MNTNRFTINRFKNEYLKNKNCESNGHDEDANKIMDSSLSLLKYPYLNHLRGFNQNFPQPLPETCNTGMNHPIIKMNYPYSQNIDINMNFSGINTVQSAPQLNFPYNMSRNQFSQFPYFNNNIIQQFNGPYPSIEPNINLANSKMWDKFGEIGNEMIITKAGRRLFPPLKITVANLNPNLKYIIIVDMIPSDNNRYRYVKDKWCVGGKAEPHMSHRVYIHPDSPLTGYNWMKQLISFHKLKLTNHTMDNKGHMILNSMHKYQPRIHIFASSDLYGVDWSHPYTKIFKSTIFIAVTSYQNEQITQLKINNNPFAKGFRETSDKYPRNTADMIISKNLTLNPQNLDPNTEIKNESGEGAVLTTPELESHNGNTLDFYRNPNYFQSQTDDKPTNFDQFPPCKYAKY
ncbi:T-box transcription factor tbx-8 [Intoshia linei]|uniref:T-box transcription factor tbx-8 n=1 Tax=Intoshia linei TaxID=1819745 RepID=A0A177B966_9BILA|nr:T-box transcription factor tbx-8 [Intoshia linei]